MKGDYPENLLECIEEFLSTDHTRPAGLDVYQDLFDTSVFYPLQRQAEMARMMQISRTIHPQTIMEIGSDRGSGIYAFCKSLLPARMISCEIRGTPYRSLLEKAFPNTQFLWLEESSYEPATIKTVKQWLQPTKIDILFLDGEKSYFNKDWDAYLPLMSPSGIVFFHDITEPGNPTETFHRVRNHYNKWEEVIDRSDTKESMDRGGEARTSHDGWLRFWKGSYAGVGVIYLNSKK